MKNAKVPILPIFEHHYLQTEFFTIYFPRNKNSIIPRSFCSKIGVQKSEGLAPMEIFMIPISNVDE